MADVATLFRFFVALTFLMAAIPKAVGPGEFRRAVANYNLLPGAFVQPVALALPIAEFAVAVVLALNIVVAPAAVAAGSLLVVFAAAAAVNLARGRRIECGCRGAVAPTQIGWALVLGDLVLGAMAFLVAAVPPSSGPPSIPLAAIASALVLGRFLVAEARNVAQGRRRLHLLAEET